MAQLQNARSSSIILTFSPRASAPQRTHKDLIKLQRRLMREKRTINRQGKAL